MSEKPILFSGEMVRAILDGRKSETRRVIRHRENRWEIMEDDDGSLWPYWPCYVYAEPEPIRMECPYGEAGDTLWVRETWAVAYEYEPGSLNVLRASNDEYAENCKRVLYRATDTIPDDVALKWRPSIHMPRWASRISLLMKEVRVERLHEITEEGAKAEGIYLQSVNVAPPIHTDIRYVAPGVEMTRSDGEKSTHAPAHYTAVEAFHCLWDSINAKRGFPWESNPWVWTVKFEVKQ